MLANQRKELSQALKNVQKALTDARTEIENLEENLSVLDDFILEQEDFSEETLEIKHELHKLFMSLPTRETFESYVEKIEKAITEMETE